MRFFGVFLVLITYSTAFAQQPSYFKIGENELAGIHIYDLLQDENLDYWLATNNGLYQYDYYNFIKKDCPEMSSSSVFNLIQNKQGQLFCNNLSGQIFTVIKGGLRLFYQVPDSLMHHEISIEIDNRDQLTVLAKKLFTIDKNKEIQVHQINDTLRFTGDLIKDADGALNFYSSEFKQVYRFQDEKIQAKEEFSKKFRPWLLCLKNKRLIFNRGTGELVFNNGHEIKTSGQEVMAGAIFYSDNENIWRASRTGGVKIYDSSLVPFYNDRLVLQEFFVSSFLRDQEGNTLLGTFGDGLVVIPSMSTNEFQVPGLNERASKMICHEDGRLFVGCRSGKVFEIDEAGTAKQISDESKKTIEYMFFLPSENELIFDGNPNRPTLSYNYNNGKEGHYEIYSVKDVKHVDSSRYLTANNQGCFWFDASSNSLDKIEALSGRTNCVGYEKDAKIIYSGSSAGLIIFENERKDYFELDDEPIICRNIISFQEKIYITTQKQGVLVFNNGALIENWNTNSGLSTNNVYEIIPYKSKFIVSRSGGVYLTSSKGETVFKFSTALGLSPIQPVDIELSQNNLYIVYKDGIKIIDIQNLDFEAYTPQVQLKEWLVNDKPKSLNQTSLTPNQNKIQLSLSSKSLKHNDETEFHYKLSGIDLDWQVRPHTENIIEYKSLPAGDYTFNYFSSCNNVESKTKKFKFSISLPYYQTFWFYGLIVLFFLSVVYMVYTIQLARQKKLSKLKRETIESKLIAIQSQMNPHFIFNSLNSIQDLVLQQDQESAYNYISKFAFLVREVLHQSEVDFIRLEDEIKMLEVYLELEKLRFEDDFTFSMNNQVSEEIEIPPMLIQPYIENAIKHGLLHKEGPKTLEVTFQQDNNKLIVEVEDNGVGRKRSKDINLRKSKGHKSFATTSTAGRFEMLQNVHNGTFGAEYLDKMNPSGTIVTLTIPVRMNY